MVINSVVWEWFKDAKLIDGDKVILIGEPEDEKISGSSGHKKVFQETYPNLKFITLDKAGNPDIKYDLCYSEIGSVEGNKFELAVCQATLEHTVNPLMAIKNIMMLSKQAIFHIPRRHNYHAYPVDCWRMEVDAPNEIAHLLGLRLIKETHDDNDIEFWLERI